MAHCSRASPPLLVELRQGKEWIEPQQGDRGDAYHRSGSVYQDSESGFSRRIRTRRVLYEWSTTDGKKIVTGQPGPVTVRLNYERGRITSRPLTFMVRGDGVPAKVIAGLATANKRRIRAAFEYDHRHVNEEQRTLARKLVADAAGSPLEPYLTFWLAYEEVQFFLWRERSSLANGSAGQRALTLLDGLIQGTRVPIVRENALYLAYLLTRFAREKTDQHAAYLARLRREFPDSYLLFEIDSRCVKELRFGHRGCAHNPW